MRGSKLLRLQSAPLTPIQLRDLLEPRLQPKQDTAYASFLVAYGNWNTGTPASYAVTMIKLCREKLARNSVKAPGKLRRRRSRSTPSFSMSSPRSRPGRFPRRRKTPRRFGTHCSNNRWPVEVIFRVPDSHRCSGSPAPQLMCRRQTSKFRR